MNNKDGSDFAIQNKPKEKILIDNWNEYWNPSEADAIPRLMDRIQYRTIFKATVDKGEKPKHFSLSLIKSLPGFSAFPEKIPAWTDDNNTKYEEVEINSLNYLKEVINKRKIGHLFRDYYNNIYKSAVSLVWLTISFVLMIGILIFFVVDIFVGKLFLDTFNSDPKLFWYILSPLLYSTIIVLLIKEFIGSQIRPSKWHWFDILLILSVPISLYILEINTDFIIFNLFDIEPLSGEMLFVLRNIGLINLLFISLCVLATMTWSIIPCTPKGQIFYSLINFEMSAKIGGGSNVKSLSNHLSLLLTSLNDVISKFFNLIISNQQEIMEKFNMNLLQKGTDFLPTIKILDQENLVQYFSKDIIFKDQNSEKQKLEKFEKTKRKNEEYIDTLNSINFFIKPFINLAVQPTFARLSLKNNFKNQFQKIISITITIVTFIATTILPLIL